ncbi:MAG: aminotransferase class V-fold PLP-dependent enzyme [Geodermatophilaceae bacterium]
MGSRPVRRRSRRPSGWARPPTICPPSACRPSRRTSGDHRLRAGAAAGRFQACKIIGPQTIQDRGGAISFTFGSLHPHDIGQVLDSYGIAVRGGHHCAKPVHRRFGVGASTRASGYLYTTTAEIDALADGLEQVRRFFGVG